MSESDSKEIVLDVRGQMCPATLLVAMAKLNEHRQELLAGEVSLLLISDNRHATATIPETARNMGYEAEVTQEEGYYTIRIGLKKGN